MRKNTKLNFMYILIAIPIYFFSTIFVNHFQQHEYIFSDVNNIKKYHNLCTEYKKELWPMIKTHKSMEIVEMQIKEGATGVLCGTLDEAEACCQKGVKKIMYAYPVASEENIKRIIEMSKKTEFIIRLDSLEAAIKINKIAETENIIINYT